MMNRHQHDPSGSSINDNISQANSSPTESGDWAPLLANPSSLARVQPLMRLTPGIDRDAESTLLPNLNDPITTRWGQHGFNSPQVPPSRRSYQPEEKQLEEEKKPSRGVKRNWQASIMEPTPLGSRRHMRVVMPGELGISSLRDSETILECLRPLLPSPTGASPRSASAVSTRRASSRRHHGSTTEFVHSQQASRQTMDHSSSSSSSDEDEFDDVDYSIDYTSPADGSESYVSESKSTRSIDHLDRDKPIKKRKKQKQSPPASTSETTAKSPTPAGEVRFRASHTKQWWERYQDMVQFKETNGHCVVPLYNPSNPSLSHWVKRQRCQYKLKLEGKHSTLTEERQKLLEDLGFTWDSHNAAWEERFHELLRFKEEHGHCDVPSTYKENPPLASWIKCQRRYIRMYFRREADKKAAAERITAAGSEVGGDALTITGPQHEAQFTKVGKKPRTISHSLDSDRVQRMIDVGIQWEKKTGKKKSS